MVFRTTYFAASLFALILFSIAAFAQQGAPSPALPESVGSSAQNQQKQTQPPANPENGANQANALPDEPGTTAHVTAPLVPTGPTAVFDTSMGRMVCRLYSREAPLTTANFVGLATGSKGWKDPLTHKKIQGRPFYNGTTFHRVIPGFMIQGGDRLGTGVGDAGYFFNDEVTPALNFDVAGRLAMANAGPNTNSAQFFITVAPQPSLDQHYSIFGQCDPNSVLVAQAITQVPRNGQDKPLESVYLNKVTIVQPGQPLPAPPTSSAPKTSPSAAAQP